MIELQPHEMGAIAPLFAGMTDTLITSCLQGHMGRAWADSAEHPRSAKIITADFCYVGGNPDRELALFSPPRDGGFEYFVIDPSKEWAELFLDSFRGHIVKFTRYAMKHDASRFDRDKLRAYTREIPSEYRLAPIDCSLCSRIVKEEWSRDFCANFDSAEDYARRGIGVAALRGEEICAGASSYTIFDGGIEIEIGTKDEHRRKGLARACGAELILRCLERGLYPSWDAANLVSSHLAQTLGYQFDREYDTYAVQMGAVPC